MSATATARAIRRLARPLRLLSDLGWTAAALGLGLACLGAIAWSARLGLLDQPWWVLLAWGVALVATGAVAWLARRSRRGLSPAAVARRLEGAGGDHAGAWRRGGLTMLLEPAAEGTSPGLLEAADRAAADSVEARGAPALAALRAAARGRAVGGGTALVAGVVLVAAAGPGPGVGLWHPAKAWEATVAPVRLRADRIAVEQGASVTLTVEAPGRRRAVLWLRAPGEPFRPTALALDSTGRGARTVGPLAADLFARATSGRRGSDTVAVRVRLPVFVGVLSVVARYPAYLGLEDEPLPLGRDTLLLPAGTRLVTTGEATADLASAAWESGSQRAALAVDGPSFRGTFAPTATGGYRLALATRSGQEVAGDPAELVLRIAPDRAPAVDVPVPGADTLAPLSLRVPLVIDVRDDYGITAVTVVSRRVSRLGFADSALRETVPLPPGVPDRAILPFELDLTARGLLPGDTLRYTALAVDNAPGGQVGRSREFVLRLPTLSEVRAAAREASQSVAGRLDSLVTESRQAERRAEDLSRERAREEGRAGSEGAKLSFEEAKRAQGAADAQEALGRRVEELQRALEALQESMRAAGIDDPEWQRRLQEIQEQLERALSSELREKLAELQRALQELDPARTREALEKLAEAQRTLREALERSRELFRRAALEGDMANLAEESREVARQQEQWTREAETAEAARAAAEEAALAARVDSLAAQLERVAAELSRQQAERGEGLQEAAQQAEAAAQQMQQASESARQGQRRQAQQQGRQALDRLQPLGERLEQERESMQSEWRQEVLDAIDRALAETSRLGQRQLAVAAGLRRGGSLAEGRTEQASVEEGVQKLLEQVKSISGKNALVSPQIAVALIGAQLQMRQARDAIATASPNPREAAERSGEAVDALNAAAYMMLRSRSAVSGSASGSGLAEALEQLSKLAGQQGNLNQQAGGLLPLAGRAGIQEQLRRLGAEQRALAEELERLRAQGHAGAGELGEEAKELARQLEAGRLDRQTVERQERLFRRMLDAGRTLQGKEEDERKERQSTAATGDSVRLPTTLLRTLQEGDRIRVPTWEELQRFSPEERRLVVDYFRRLSESAR